MPKLNALGSGCGAWSTGVHVNGRLVWSSPTGGASDANWLSESLVVAQLFDIEGARVSMLDLLETPAVETVIWHNGATIVRSGGMQSAASASGRVQIQGVPTVPYALCDVSPTGVVVLTPTQSNNSLVVKRPAGDLALATGPLVNDSVSGPDVRLRGDVLVYRGASIVLWDVAANVKIPYTPITAQPVNLTVPLILPTGLALLELGNGRLTLRPHDSTRGIVVATGPTFAPDVVLTEAGEVVVAWSTLAGEAPSAYRSVSLPLATLFDHAIELNTPLVEVVPPAPKLVLPVLAPFTRPVVVMITKDLRAESDAPVELIANQMVQQPRPDGSYRDCWAASDSLAGVRGHLIGIYGENDDVPVAMAEAESLTRGYHVRVMWVSDSKAVRPVPANLRPGDLVGTEFYLDPDGGDTVERAVLRWIANLNVYRAAWDGELVVVLPFYCMGQAPPHELYTEQETLDAIAAGCALLETEPRVTLIDAFEWDRANGIVTHAGLKTTFQRLLVAAQGAAVTPIEKPEESEMTISQRAAYDAAVITFGAMTVRQWTRHTAPDMCGQAIQAGARAAGVLTEDEMARCLEFLVDTRGDASKARDLVWPPKI